jgi:hypothetical protein
MNEKEIWRRMARNEIDQTGDAHLIKDDDSQERGREREREGEGERAGERERERAHTGL